MIRGGQPIVRKHLYDSVLAPPQEPTLTKRLERAVYLQLDMRNGLCGKYIGGEKRF